MKRLLLLISVVAFSHISYGQLGQCTPNPTFADSSGGVYPLPFDSLSNPKGGINLSACIGHPYQFIFQVVIPDTINYPGFGLIPLTSFAIPTTGAITNLPNGLTYVCNPPNCSFNANTLGCMAIYGTVAGSVSPGEYDLIISGTLTALGFPFAFTFPNAQLYPGHYYLKVEPINSTTCYKVSTSDARTNNFFADVNPNPVNQYSNLLIFSKKNLNLKVSIQNINGAEIENFNAKVTEGKNSYQLDTTNWANGVYLYKIGEADDFTVGKIVVQH